MREKELLTPCGACEKLDSVLTVQELQADGTLMEHC